MKRIRGAVALSFVVALSGCTAPSEGDETTTTASAGPGALTVLPGLRDSVHGWEIGPEGLLARISLNDRVGSRQLSLAPDGTVVLVADTSVSAGRDDYRTWRLSLGGLGDVLLSLDDAGVRTTEPGGFGRGMVGSGSRSLGIVFGHGSVTSGSDEHPAFEPLWDLADSLMDPDRYGDALVSGPRPWAPTAVGISAGPPDRTGRAPDGLGPFRSWPLARTIREVTGGRKIENSYGEPEWATCLRGSQARRVFATLDGRNTAYLRYDDGSRWEVTVTVVTPGYALLGSPCAPV
jgi:hypothetical protein